MNVQYLNGLLFKNKIYESSGNSFQKLFSDIMVLRNPEFIRIHAHGNKGDGGNDGYVPSEKRYYQVYGPEYSDDSSNIVAYAKKKLAEDFEKICNNWEKPSNYHFVYNDFFKGAAKDLINALDDLKKRYNLSETSLITTDNLLRFFIELNDDEKISIVNAFSLSDVFSADRIDSNVIAQLIRNITSKYNPYSIRGIENNAPILAEKIRVNKLNDAIRDTLYFHSHFVNLVEDFLNTEPGMGQAVAFEMQKLYAESKRVFEDGVEDSSDLQFMWIAEKLLTDDVKSLTAEKSKIQVQRSASLVIMAKYFESCDIYEHPDCIVSS
jgi:hypothetical protein